MADKKKEKVEEMDNDSNEEVIVFEESNSDGDGIKIADDVVATIAGIAASDVPGVAGMAGGLARTEFLKF